MDNGEIDLWATHLPVLAACVANTTGPVLELGCGHYSTRLLHALCRNRQLLTIDANPVWLEKFAALRTPTHCLLSVPSIAAFLRNAGPRLLADGMNLAEFPARFSLVFEDSGRAQLRPDNIAAIRPHADLILVNNTEPGLNAEPFRPVYRYETIIPTFPYRFDYKVYPVWTSVLSESPLPAWLKEIFG